ncbi:MAG: DUF370 domain-containing protein [Oscillospiraceae bacterium]|nr:DUF370 domain-containing protein [Oscillospiraceae bacterium]
MYLHLGNEIVIKNSDIVGIFDIDNTSVSKATRDFLANAERNMQVTNVTNELPKSFVVTSGEGGSRVYISQISAQTLKRRTGYIEDL